jgi:PadR family transcriptional regulator PadR
MTSPMDLVQGTVDVLILKTLSWQPMHGYQVSRAIRVATEEELQLEEGTLYPALHRLETKGMIEAEWGLSENNRRAKYYTLTAAGRRSLEERTQVWERYARVVSRLLATTDIELA